MSPTLESFEAERRDFQRTLEAVQKIKAAPENDLGSIDWLVALIREVGLVSVPEAERTYSSDADYLNSSSQGVVQIPAEFAKYLLLLAEFKPRRYLEIGTFNGATASLASAYLQRFNENFEAATADIWPHFLFQAEMRSLLPCLRYSVGRTSFDFSGESWDAVFIDGDHSFEWAWADYQNVGRAAKICAFHDVNNAPYLDLQLGGVPAVWKLIKEQEPGATFHEIFEHPSEALMGIGVRIRETG